MGIVIRGGEVVNAAGRFQADVRIEGERIVGVGEGLSQPGDEILDASGCYVIPGGIDPHTHLEMPAGELGFNADDWFSGTSAAVAGGTTCVIDMATQERGGILLGALEAWQRRALAGAVCDWSFHMGVTDVTDEVLQEMAAVVGAGVSSFKLYLAYKGRVMVDDGAAFRVMREAGALGAWTLVHAENGEIIEVLTTDAKSRGELRAGIHGRTRPPLMEGEAAGRALLLARLAGAPVYIVHVSCREALEAVRAARQAGQPVCAEACTHHLVLTEREYDRPGFEAAPWVLSPPLRAQEHLDALWGGLATGALDLVASDHCPWNLQVQKARGCADFSLIPNGGPGIEERMSLLWTYGVRTGQWTLEEFVQRTSATAARIFGMSRKGAIFPGFDADVVVWDGSAMRKLSAANQCSRVDHSLYEGMHVTGVARFVLTRGRVAAQEGAPAGEPGWGRFVARRPR